MLKPYVIHRVHREEIAPSEEHPLGLISVKMFPLRQPVGVKNAGDAQIWLARSAEDALKWARSEFPNLALFLAVESHENYLANVAKFAAFNADAARRPERPAKTRSHEPSPADSIRGNRRS